MRVGSGERASWVGRGSRWYDGDDDGGRFKVDCEVIEGLFKLLGFAS